MRERTPRKTTRRKRQNEAIFILFILIFTITVSKEQWCVIVVLSFEIHTTLHYAAGVRKQERYFIGNISEWTQ